MTHVKPLDGVVNVQLTKVNRCTADVVADVVSVEEPLEICLVTGAGAHQSRFSVAVTMRTPGHDRELAAGFLFTEGIIAGADQIETIELDRLNVVRVTLREGMTADLSSLPRNSFVSSSCGVCGKRTIASIQVRRRHALPRGEPTLKRDVIHTLPEIARAAQETFAWTGGLHAATLFDGSGTLLDIKEDVGRHNALDKLIGTQLLSGAIPLARQVVLVSGRVSFELVQKAVLAGLPVLVAIGAPSSLAIRLARTSGMTLIGFVRDQHFNIYAGPERILGLDRSGTQR